MACECFGVAAKRGENNKSLVSDKVGVLSARRSNYKYWLLPLLGKKSEIFTPMEITPVFFVVGLGLVWKDPLRHFSSK